MALVAPHSPSSPPPLPSQRYKGFIFASAHVRDIDGQPWIKDGQKLVDIDAGFEVAPGDTIDIEVVNAHAWGSWHLVFSDGTYAATSMRIAEKPSNKGTAYPIGKPNSTISSCHQVENGAIAFSSATKQEE